MMSRRDLDQAIIQELQTSGAYQVEDLAERVARFTWNHMSSTIDRLSRDGTLAFQRPARFGYEVSITSSRHRVLEAEVSR